MTILEIIKTIYARWGDAIKDKVTGYSMENSTTVTKLPYATLYFMGLPTGASVLEGEEAAVIPSIQVDVYTKGQEALTKAYEIDELSHACLTGMGFGRSTGPQLIQSKDSSSKRLTSRYSRVIGLGDKLNE